MTYSPHTEADHARMLDAVGHVTSGTLSPTLGTKIAMALVPAALAGVGNSFEVVVRERPYRAEQVKLPFYKRQRDERS